jgi:hypothetical protein
MPCFFGAEARNINRTVVAWIHMSAGLLLNPAFI